MTDWSCYIIENNGCTYCGMSNDVHRRLRMHNGEIVGGAKYTASKGPGWEHVCIISGFPTMVNAMQCEWAIKHVAPRNAGGVAARIRKVITVLNKERWTSKSPLAADIPLIVTWTKPEHRPPALGLPPHISEVHSLVPHVQDTIP